MSEEKDWAAFYEQYKDNPEEIWGEPEEGPPQTRRRGLSATITVRFSAEEASGIRKLAKELDVSYSDIVRMAVYRFVHPDTVTKVKGYPFDSQSVAPDHEERDELPLSNATTSTGLLALAK
jgi:hypothetical protein